MTNINSKTAIVKIECYMKENIRFFKKQGNTKTPHLKIFTRQPNFVSTLRSNIPF